MANNLYIAAAVGATIRASKSLFALFNGSGSGKVVRIYDIYLLNNQTVAITGVQARFELRLITAISGGAAIAPTKFDSAISNLPSSIIISEGSTATNSTLLRRKIWSTDEPAASSSTVDEFELIPSFASILYTQIGNSNGIEPYTLREGQGITLNNTTVTNVGLLDIFVKFTVD